MQLCVYQRHWQKAVHICKLPAINLSPLSVTLAITSEAELLVVIGTKVLQVNLLAIYRHLYIII
jgi:hypothetical protein